jgi:ribosomal protein L40E
MGYNPHGLLGQLVQRTRMCGKCAEMNYPNSQHCRFCGEEMLR